MFFELALFLGTVLIVDALGTGLHEVEHELIANVFGSGPLVVNTIPIPGALGTVGHGP